MSMNFWARNGDPITMEQWSELVGNLEYKRVAYTTMGEVVVSTVWLGMNHNFDDVGPPLIFETMIFGGDLADEQWRWATEAEALDGHEKVVGEARIAHQLQLPDAEVERPVPAEEET